MIKEFLSSAISFWRSETKNILPKVGGKERVSQWEGNVARRRCHRQLLQSGDQLWTNKTWPNPKGIRIQNIINKIWSFLHRPANSNPFHNFPSLPNAMLITSILYKVLNHVFSYEFLEQRFVIIASNSVCNCWPWHSSNTSNP